MADELVSKEVLRSTRAEVDKLFQHLSKVNQERFKNDSEYATKFFIQAYKKVAEEQLNIVKDLSTRESREEAKRIAEEAKAKRTIAIEEAKNLQEQIKRVQYDKSINERTREATLTFLKEERKQKQEAANEAQREILEQQKKSEIYHSVALKNMTEREKRQDKLNTLEKKLSESNKKRADAEIALEEAKASHDSEAIENAQKALKDAKKEERKDKNAIAAEELKNSLKDSLVGAINKLANAVDSNLETLGGYQSGMMARLQGSTSNYDDMVNLVRRNLRGSPLVKQKDVLDNLQKLTEKGIAYDLEQRAFLATVRDKIATTFDAFDSTLLRLIRLQQADTTAARLGMEANLTRLLNTMFSDTSYLSDVYDTVSNAIIDANSQMSREGSLAFEYTVQKWLGALYSLGLSQSAVGAIAEGINYLGTGNISALAGNDTLQTLFAMSASRGGLAYTDLIIDGLDSSETNKLLRGMVEYLREIAEGADNLVVKSAYSQILGLSVADFAALQNLTEGEIEAIAGTNIDYTGAMSELSYQLGQISGRVPLGERIKNVFDNAMFSVASSIFELAPVYATYLITDAIEGVTGGIPLPAVYAFGSGIDLTAFTIEGIIKDAIVGLNLIGQLPFIFSSMLDEGNLGLWAWGGMPSYNTRGNEFITVQNGVVRTTSSSTYIGSSASSDIKSSSISSAAEEGEVVKSASGQGTVEYAKAAPSLEGEAADDWKKWIEFLDNNPIPVTIASFGSKPVDVNIVLGGAGELDSSYTMLDMVKRIVEGYDEGNNSFKTTDASLSTDPMIFKNKIDGVFMGNQTIWGY